MKWKPCPFCGAEDMNFPEDHDPKCWFFIRFQQDFLPGAKPATEEELGKAWNTRTDPTKKALADALKGWREEHESQQMDVAGCDGMCHCPACEATREALRRYDEEVGK